MQKQYLFREYPPFQIEPGTKKNITTKKVYKMMAVEHKETVLCFNNLLGEVLLPQKK